jgi:lipopolysaccharide export LptBFGC system permease protein LptF
MKLLNRYILKKLFTIFFIIIPAFAFISVLIQIIEKIRNIKAFEPVNFLMYLLLSLPEKFYYIIPVAAVISFFIVYRELITSRKIYPVLLNGISIRYLLFPAILFSITVFFIQLSNNLFFMPKSEELANRYYTALKSGSVEEKSQEYLFISNQWIKIDDFTFVYFGFLDLNSYTGKNFIYIKMNEKNFYPLFRIEAQEVKIKKDKLELEKGRIVALADVINFDYTIFNKMDYPVKIDTDNLKKLVKIKKPVSILQFYEKANVADKFGYPSGYFWSRFFSYLTTVFSPIVLIIFIYPWIWLKRREKYIVIFGSIIFYWYSISALASISQTGAIPYFIPLFIDLLYTLIGILILLKLKFIEL